MFFTCQQQRTPIVMLTFKLSTPADSIAAFDTSVNVTSPIVKMYNDVIIHQNGNAATAVIVMMGKKTNIGIARKAVDAS